MASVVARYTSAGCNRCPYSADWGRNGNICYAYSKAIAIYRPKIGDEAARIVASCAGHTSTVNCVAWVRNGLKEETEFVSGSADSKINIWRLTQEETPPALIATLQGHEGSVTCIRAVTVPTLSDQPDETLIVSGSIDSTVRVWRKSGDDVSELQVFNFGSGFALSVAICVLHTDHVLFALGCDDQKIHLYARQSDGIFFRVLTLTGHEDWIRGLDFTTDDSGDILLASCSQDHTIRVWRFTSKGDQDVRPISHKSVNELSPDEDITVREVLFSYEYKEKTVTLAVGLETVLCGHENWVYSVQWQPSSVDAKENAHQEMKLLSASMDKTMILWSTDSESGIWTEEIRVGDVGGNTLGFYGGLFSPCGTSILGHGYQGAFNQWSYNQTTTQWDSEVTGGGHFNSVVDLAWCPDGGDFLLSTSWDQTTRLHAPWVTEDGKSWWYEIARPQVHGYDIQCLAMLGKYSFASGADEKLVRVFKAPKNFITNFCQICGHSLNKETEREEYESLPQGANVPALGLSNKAVFSDDKGEGEQEKEELGRPGQYPENYFTAIDFKAPPSEDLLLQNTLWPEEAKLYGHGFEIYSLAAHPSGKVLASACKAAKADAANIFLWDVESKKMIGSLGCCTLTVTQMAFNHYGNELLTVSRDRTWALFTESGDGSYTLKAFVNKRSSPHARIIWSCAWSHDDKYFFTASRDKKVCAWSVMSLPKLEEEKYPVPVSVLTASDSVTAVSAAPLSVRDDRYLVAIGLEAGHIHLYLCSPVNPSDSWTLISSLTPSEAHHMTVTRLAFRPIRKGDRKDILQLASCGADHAVRVYDVRIHS